MGLSPYNSGLCDGGQTVPAGAPAERLHPAFSPGGRGLARRTRRPLVPVGDPLSIKELEWQTKLGSE